MQDERPRSMTSDGGGGQGGDPPHFPALELLTARVDGTEKRLERIEARLDRIDDRLRAVETGLAEIKGSLTTLTASVVGKLPSWWQMPAVIGATVVLVLLIFTGARILHSLG